MGPDAPSVELPVPEIGTLARYPLIDRRTDPGETMPPKTALRRETASFPIAGLKAVSTATGSFDAIVSVFGNIDYHGHRIDAKAFDASIERWQTSGDPIPVIFSHMWDDLSAYLGTVDPANVEALQPGDAELPEAIREFGGLRVRGVIDTDESEGRKALKLLKTRAVREFSFAYDVLDEEKADDGFVDLLELDLIEVGPTLKGANPLTQLIGAKAAANRETIGETIQRVADVLDAKSDDLARWLGVEPVAPAVEADASPTRGAKAFVSLPDTVERLQEAILRAGKAWAADTYGDNLYAVMLEGTYPVDGRAVLYVELWDDPPYQGRYFEASFEVTDGVVVLGTPEVVELVAAVVDRPAPAEGTEDEEEEGTESRAKRIPAGRDFGFAEGRRNASSDLARIQSIHDLTADLGAACAEPDGEASDDDEEEEGTESRIAENLDPAILRARLDADLIDL